MRWLLICLGLLFGSPAVAQFQQFPPGVFSHSQALDPAPAVTYQGPIDVVAGAEVWYSLSRGISASYSNGTNPLADLVDSAAPTTVICTLRVKTNGFVDLTGTYCTGSVTPATKCAAATGGVCHVEKLYNQGSTGSTNDCTQTTAGNQPVLQFSSLSGLPGMLFTNAATTFMACSAYTRANPYSASGVWTVSNVITTSIQTMLGCGTTGNPIFGKNTSANTAAASADGTAFITVSATDTSPHALNTNVNSGAGSVIMSDGTDGTSGTTNAAGFLSGCILRVGHSNGGAQMDGTFYEAGIWNATFTGTNRTNLNNNQHGTNGYNF